jgi:Flp pilus assembly pilin Flp
MLKLFVALQTRFVELRESQKGQAYVEYGVLLALVAIALIVTLGFFADDIQKAFDKIGNTVSSL